MFTSLCFSQVTKSVLSLLSYYKWKKFSIIFDNDYTTVATSLREQAKARNMTVSSEILTMDSHKCCEKSLPCCQVTDWYKIIQDTKNRTRSKLNNYKYI